MKKNIVIIILIVLVITSISLSLFFYNDLKKEYTSLKEKVEEQEKTSSSYDKVPEKKEEENNREEENTSNQGYSHITPINYETFLNKITQKENFILVVTQTYCSHCHDFKPVINKVLKEQELIAYELDLQTLTPEERKATAEIINVSGTPTTLFFENGEENITYRLVGSVSEETIINHLKEAHYIR